MRVEQASHWREAVEWLVGAVRDVDDEGRVARTRPIPPGLPESDLAVAAEFHGVQSFARLAAQGRHDALDRDVHAAQARHLRSLSDLALALDALRPAGIEPVVLKGPSLVATAYAGSPLRASVDLDLLVAPADVGRVVRLLEDAGCRLLDANWTRLAALHVRELMLATPSGGTIDLHWSAAGGSGAEDDSPRVDLLLRRSETVELADVGFRILDPADLLVHTALHAASSGGHRLIWLADLRGAVAYASGRLPITELATRAREWRAGPALAVMLSRARSTIGAEVPDELVAARSSRLWVSLSAATERRWRPELAGQGGSPARLLARSCRRSTATSIAAAAAKGLSWVRQRGPVPVGPDVMHDPENPLSAFYPSGGREAAEAFFERLAEGRRE